METVIVNERLSVINYYNDMTIQFKASLWSGMISRTNSSSWSTRHRMNGFIFSANQAGGAKGLYRVSPAGNQTSKPLGNRQCGLVHVGSYLVAAPVTLAATQRNHSLRFSFWSMSTDRPSGQPITDKASSLGISLNMFWQSKTRVHTYIHRFYAYIWGYLMKVIKCTSLYRVFGCAEMSQL